MEFKVLAPGGNELQVVNSLPETFKGSHFKHANAMSGSAEFGSITFQHFAGNGFNIWFSNYDIAHQTTMIGKADLPVIELHSWFASDVLIQWDGLGNIPVQKFNYNLSYVPFVNNTATFLANKSYTAFDVHFELPYLEAMANYFPSLDNFLDKVVNNQPAKISTRDRFLSPVMIEIVNAVLRCPFSNGAAGRFIESKIMELLLYALEDLSGNDPLVPIKLSAQDIECLHEAKRLITEDFQNKMSLIELSRKVYLNDFKLKKGFKYLFGTTVFEHMNNERMKQAKEMVLDKQFSFLYISVALGYQSESSFNKAFKKYYGVTPGYVRKHM